MNNTFKLPDGTKLPLDITIPAADKCEVGNPAHCQNSEGMRKKGYSDPQTCKDVNNPCISGIYEGKNGNKWRVKFPIPMNAVLMAGLFDAEKPLPEGTVITLPKPYEAKLVEKRGQRANPRKDKGMPKKEADEKFGRKPGPYKGRRTDQLKSENRGNRPR